MFFDVNIFFCGNLLSAKIGKIILYLKNIIFTINSADCNIKEIVEGNSIIVLSEEEQEALNRAMGKKK